MVLLVVAAIIVFISCGKTEVIEIMDIEALTDVSKEEQQSKGADEKRVGFPLYAGRIKAPMLRRRPECGLLNFNQYH